MESNVISFLKGKNIKVIEESDNGRDKTNERMVLWRAWYQGFVDNFHLYKVYAGEREVEKKRRTLNMAARVCQDWADLLLNEKVEITVSNEAAQEVLNRLLKQVDFTVRGNNLIQAAFALGGGFLIQYWDGESKQTKQKYITQEYVYPISVENGRITEAAFASEKIFDSEKYKYIEVHIKENNIYKVINYLLTDKNGALAEVSEEFYEKINLEREILMGTIPTFQQIRPNVANKDKFDSPFGTSIYADALDVFEGTDIIYDNYINEFVLGRKRIFAHDSVSNVLITETGETVRAFNPDDDTFYLLPASDADNTPPIIESNMALRTAEFDAGLQTQLNLISQLCGFGENGYKWSNGSVSTATQIISENSKMFRTLKKHEELLESAIIDMVHGLLFIENKFSENPVATSVSVTIDFDDSIIEDTAEIKRQAMLDYNAGLIDAIEYYITVYHMDEKQATDYYNKIQARKPEIEEEPAPEGE